ncbi:hypothetical protein LINPERHAP1_LOCUS28355, partial [Linum perenne]
SSIRGGPVLEKVEPTEHEPSLLGCGVPCKAYGQALEMRVRAGIGMESGEGITEKYRACALE